MRHHLPLFTSLVAITPTLLPAQVNQRPITQISRGFTQVSSPAYWFGWAPVTPRGPATQANPSVGSVASNQLAYVYYMDKDVGGATTFEVRRSIDGGFSWEPPKELFKLASGETWRADETGGVAEGSTAYLFTTVYQSTGASEIRVWGTEDQGQTWLGPMNASPGMAAGNLFYVLGQRREVFRNNVKGAISQGALHLCYEAAATWQGASATRRGDLYYTSIHISNNALATANPEIRVNKNSPVGTTDIDFPDIAADGSLVAIAWLDDRASPGVDTWNNCYSVVSPAGGTGIGTTAAETNHTGLTAALPRTPLPPRVAASVTNVYVTMEDARANAGDALYLDYNGALGAGPFTTVQVAASTDSRSRADSHYITTEANRVGIAFRTSAGVHVIVDENSGRDITAGNVQPKMVSSGSSSQLFAIDMRRDTIAVFYEIIGNGGEDGVVAYSSDAGQSWKEANVDSRSGDIDENYGAVTGNGDILNCHIWSASGNSTNHTYITGFKVPTLENLFQSAGTGWKLYDLNPSMSGKTALLMFSGSAGGGIVFNRDGFSVNLAPDPIYQAYLSVLFASPVQFLATVDNNGEATWPTIPNYAALLGLKLVVAAAVVDPSLPPNDPAFYITFSDPIE